MDPRPDAQDLTSRALARSRPSHVCALADEPELGGVELMVAAGMRDIEVHPPLLLALASRLRTLECIEHAYHSLVSGIVVSVC